MQNHQETRASGGRVSHWFKTWTTYFEEVWSGRKPFEVRRDDRDVQPGDLIRLAEWDHGAERFTGRVVTADAGYVLRGQSHVVPVPEGYCIFGILDRSCQTFPRDWCPPYPDEAPPKAEGAAG